MSSDSFDLNRLTVRQQTALLKMKTADATADNRRCSPFVLDRLEGDYYLEGKPRERPRAPKARYEILVDDYCTQEISPFIDSCQESDLLPAELPSKSTNSQATSHENGARAVGNVCFSDEERAKDPVPRKEPEGTPVLGEPACSNVFLLDEDMKGQYLATIDILNNCRSRCRGTTYEIILNSHLFQINRMICDSDFDINIFNCTLTFAAFDSTVINSVL